ncbi:MAG TPA: LamG-like jellyroll fold domain-containing protein [Kofleriaceae bacterium]
MIARFAALWLAVAQAGCLEAPPGAPEPAAPGHSLELFGHPYEGNGIDRAWIAAARPSPVGRLGSGEFTIELWLKTEAADVADTGACPLNWWEGTILLDREFFVAPQNGSVGISLYRADGQVSVVVGFTVIDLAGLDLCGTFDVGDGEWHHVAMTRDRDDLVSIWVDGSLDKVAAGPAGDGSFANELEGEQTADRFMVLGGPKQAGNPDAGFAGWIDDVRLSNEDLYQAPFDRPFPPLPALAETLALYSFDEGAGTDLANRAGEAGNGELRVGGEPPGPVWSDDVPLPEESL